MTTAELDRELDSLISEFHCNRLDHIPDNGVPPVDISDFNDCANCTVHVLSELKKAIIKYLQNS